MLGMMVLVTVCIGGLVGGIGLAILIGLANKGRSENASFWIAFFASVWVTVPASAYATFEWFIPTLGWGG